MQQMSATISHKHSQKSLQNTESGIALSITEHDPKIHYPPKIKLTKTDSTAYLRPFTWKLPLLFLFLLVHACLMRTLVSPDEVAKME